MLPSWLVAVLAQQASGPLIGTGDTRDVHMGWAAETGIASVSESVLTVKGDSRLYLVRDGRMQAWGQHEYVRLDLDANPLSYTLDLSKVPCGCLACVYGGLCESSWSRSGRGGWDRR